MRSGGLNATVKNAKLMKTIRTLITLLTMHLAPVLHAADGSLLFSPAAQQRVEVPNFAGLGIANEVTVEFWALSTSAGISQSVFMLNPDTATNRFQSHLNYFNGNTYWDFGDIGNGGRVQVMNNSAWLNNWTHFALTAKSGTGMKIYANGTHGDAHVKSAQLGKRNVHPVQRLGKRRRGQNLHGSKS